MKKSNWILLGILCTIFLFFSAFQFSIHSYIRKGTSEEDIIKNDEEVVSEVRNISSFRKILVSHGIEVFYKQDSVVQIKVEAYKSLVPYIKTEVKNGELVIEKMEEKRTKDTVKVYVSNQQLDTLIVDSNAYFQTIGKISGKDLNLEFSGDSRGNLELSYDHVTCSATPGSKVKLKGDSKEINFLN